MKWEKASEERKRDLADRLCAMLGLQTDYGVNGDMAVAKSNSFRNYIMFASVDDFFFGNLLSDHTPSPISGQGHWSFEQMVAYGFGREITDAVMQKFETFGAWDSFSELDVRLSAAGF